MHDTSAFDLSLYPEDPDQNITVQELHLFEPSSLFLNCSETTLGETIWLRADINDRECQEIADRLVKNFLKDTKFTARLTNQGKLLKIPLFEYEISQGNQPNKLYRILVWLNNQAIEPEITPVYDYLFATLSLYHKIEYVYKQAQESYSKARKAYSDIEAKIQEFKPDRPLEELQKLLEAMPEISMQYQRQLRNLQAHYTTIKTNRINYRNYLQKFWRQGDISSWQEFGEIACQRYLDQIETYLSYIQPGKDLINEFINTLRGLVEVEQAKSDRLRQEQEKESDRQLQETLQENERKEKERDRNLQTRITIVGIGIGVAGVTATAFPYYKKQPDGQNSSPHPMIESITISLIVGLFAAIVVWGLISLPALKKILKKKLNLGSPETS